MMRINSLLPCHLKSHFTCCCLTYLFMCYVFWVAAKCIYFLGKACENWTEKAVVYSQSVLKNFFDILTYSTRKSNETVTISEFMFSSLTINRSRLGTWHLSWANFRHTFWIIPIFISATDQTVYVCQLSYLTCFFVWISSLLLASFNSPHQLAQVSI